MIVGSLTGAFVALLAVLWVKLPGNRILTINKHLAFPLTGKLPGQNDQSNIQYMLMHHKALEIRKFSWVGKPIKSLNILT